MVLTRAQRQAVYGIWRRLIDGRSATIYSSSRYVPSYRWFRRTAVTTAFFDDVVMVSYAGMQLGVERDGYTHS